MQKVQEISSKSKQWTEQELSVLKEIHEGLRLNGWNLNHIERRGRGWVFFIMPLEEIDEALTL